MLFFEILFQAVFYIGVVFSTEVKMAHFLVAFRNNALLVCSDRLFACFARSILPGENGNVQRLWGEAHFPPMFADSARLLLTLVVFAVLDAKFTICCLQRSRPLVFLHMLVSEWKRSQVTLKHPPQRGCRWLTSEAPWLTALRNSDRALYQIIPVLFCSRILQISWEL